MGKSGFHPLSERGAPYLLSALLLGLSYPSYPYVRLELFAWVWMVPMLLALKPVTSFCKFVRNVYLTMLMVFVCGMSWLVMANVLGGVLLFFIGSLVFTVPFIFFYLIRRALGWRIALWTAPLLWTSWDWLYQQTEGSFGWISIGLSQSNLNWMVQYADITGVWGITFWLTLFNVLVVMAFEEWRATKRIWVRRVALPLGLMILLPLAYSAWVFTRAAQADKQITVLLVQPNIDPWQKMDDRAASLEKCIALTRHALATTKPDLIIWPETAIPYALPHDQELKKELGPIIARWSTPLLTGTLDLRTYAEDEARPPLLRDEQRDFDVFNAATLLVPAADKHTVSFAGEVYHKQVLMPFLERVPFADRLPSLTRLAAHFGEVQNMGRGDLATSFSFNTGAGQSVRVAAPICYEQLYPAKMAEFVRGGAEMFALLTNEGWWSKTHGQYQLAAFTRLRSIETRRTIARCANTGLTCLIDPLGRTYEQAPWWEARTLTGTVRLSSETSLYVRYPDYFPKACLWLSLSLLMAALAAEIGRVRMKIQVKGDGMMRK
ncbi:MAG TPA: apolipoprotein N-acyltransferase [Blastocatellia bacterium]|nr:apolipoprotein N-acyltransferase [Blastocatellia bacterium]